MRRRTMAELKFQEDQFQPLTPEEQTEQSTRYADQLIRPEVVSVPTSPAHRLAVLSRLEKYLIASIIIGAIALGLFTINLRTTISSVENAISTVQSEITTNQNQINDLRQEKNELTKTDRIKKIAEEKGLTNKEDNLRNVK